MTNIQIHVTGAEAVGTLEGILTAGMVGVPVRFTLDEVWEELEKTAVFRCGGETVVTPLTETLTVPWQVLKKQGCSLHIGVYGLAADGSRAIPTVWVDMGRIQPGADPEGTPAGDPQLPMWKQALETARLAMDLAQQVCDRADSGGFDGYSPVKGLDYWTDQDKREMLELLEENLTGPIDRVLDEILAIQQQLMGGGL